MAWEYRYNIQIKDLMAGKSKAFKNITLPELAKKLKRSTSWVYSQIKTHRNEFYVTGKKTIEPKRVKILTKTVQEI